MNEMIGYTLKGNVAEIQLQNGKVNAFSPDFIAAINGALDQAEKDGAAVLFIGNPGIFSAGFDLNVFKSGDREAVADMLQSGGELCTRLVGFPRPVVSAVTGHCMAQGVMFIMACDYIVGAAGNFTLGLNETQIGMVLPHYAIELVKGRFPKQVWTRVATNAELYDPQVALELGLLDKVVDADALLDTARAEVQRLADLDARAFAGNKQRMRAGQFERLAAACVQDGQDVREGRAM